MIRAENLRNGPVSTCGAHFCPMHVMGWVGCQIHPDHIKLSVAYSLHFVCGIILQSHCPRCNNLLSLKPIDSSQIYVHCIQCGWDSEQDHFMSDSIPKMVIALRNKGWSNGQRLCNQPLLPLEKTFCPRCITHALSRYDELSRVGWAKILHLSLEEFSDLLPLFFKDYGLKFPLKSEPILTSQQKSKITYTNDLIINNEQNITQNESASEPSNLIGNELAVDLNGIPNSIEYLQNTNSSNILFDSNQNNKFCPKSSDNMNNIEKSRTEFEIDKSINFCESQENAIDPIVDNNIPILPLHQEYNQESESIQAEWYFQTTDSDYFLQVKLINNQSNPISIQFVINLPKPLTIIGDLRYVLQPLSEKSLSLLLIARNIGEFSCDGSILIESPQGLISLPTIIISISHISEMGYSSDQIINIRFSLYHTSPGI